MADNKVNFLRGTSAEYEASTKDNDTFYYTTDDGKLYLGNKEITNGGVTIDDTLSDTSKNPVQNKVINAALNNKAELTDIPDKLPADGGNADTVNGHTVNANVPADAVFTDTTYKTVSQTEDGLMSAADKEKLDGVGALNDYGIADDSDTRRMHIYQPRINNVSVDSLTADELLAWADKTVKPIAQKAVKGKGGFKAGEWCKFCPHAGRCRELTKTCTTYVETHSLRVAVPVLAPHEVAEVLEMEPLITLWLKRVKAQALTTLLDGGEVPGYKVVEGKLGNRKWTDELQVLNALKQAGFKSEEVTETKLLSPAGMDKVIGKKKVAELLDSLIDRSPGAPTIVPASDKRPPLDRLAEAVKDFEIEKEIKNYEH